MSEDWESIRTCCLEPKTPEEAVRIILGRLHPNCKVISTRCRYFDDIPPEEHKAETYSIGIAFISQNGRVHGTARVALTPNDLRDGHDVLVAEFALDPDDDSAPT